MRHCVCFQYKAASDERPQDGCEFDFDVDDGQLLCLPSVGDTVSYVPEGGERAVARKVVTLHFSYQHGKARVHINIVVTDVPGGEMATRLKA